MAAVNDTNEPEVRDPFAEGVRANYEREDERWSRANQLRDWLILFAIGFIHFLWMLIVFLLEPGIR